MDVKHEGDGVHAQSSKQTTERIQALAEVSKKIPQVLQHAGLAVNSLTRNPLPADASPGDEVGVLAANKKVFKENYAAFLQLLNEVTASLTDEVDALVDAKLLPEKPPKKGVLGDGITNEGLGNLDVGYLNSRTRDVGQAKEKELVAELKVLLETLVQRQEEEADVVGDNSGKGDAMDETD